MKQSKLFLLIIIVFLILFTGCSKSPKPDNNGSEPPKPVEPKLVEVLVSADYLADELLCDYDSFEEFSEFEDENYQKVIFSTNAAAKDFRFIEVAFKEKDDNIVFYENESLYSLEELTPEKPLVVTWMEQGSIPHRGISFLDEGNIRRYFYLSMSGEDGSLLIVEFENEQ